MKRFLFPLMLIAVMALVLYAPIRYSFIYPPGGGDTATHIQSLISITEDLSKVSSLGYYGVVSLLPFTLAGLDSITVIFWFNYIVVIGVFISLWLLLKTFYGLPAALLAFPLAVLLGEGIWELFNDGTIFSIANLYIFGILAITCLALWLKYGRLKYLALSGVLFLITAVYHSVTYQYILASMGLFFTGFLIYKLVRHESYTRLLYSAGVFCLSIPLAYFTWFHNSGLEQRTVQTLTIPITGVLPSVGVPLPIPEFPPMYFYFTTQIADYLTTTSIAAILFILSIIGIIILYRKGTKLSRQDLTDKLNQPLTYILLSFLVVFTIGAFTPLGYNCGRFMMELISFGGILASILLGISLSHLWKYKRDLKQLYPGIYRSILPIILGVLLVSIVIGVIVSAGHWTSNYSAIKPVDIKAINYLNSLQRETGVLVSPNIIYQVYQFYVKDNINFTYSVDSQPDYVIYRNEGMLPPPRLKDLGEDITQKLKREWADYESHNLTEEPIVVYEDKELIIKIWER